MDISRNLIISIAFHFMLLTAVISAGRWGTAAIPAEKIIMVLLMSRSEERAMPEEAGAVPSPVQVPAPRVTAPQKPLPLPKKIPANVPVATPAEEASPQAVERVPERVASLPAAVSADAGGVAAEIPGDRGTGHPLVPQGDAWSAAGSRGRMEGVSLIHERDMPAAKGSSSDLIGMIRRAIDRSKHYPLIAKKRGVEGTVSLEFTINGRGRPENVRVVKSSGSDMLDAAALRTVSAAAPLPVVEGVLEIPIVYRIEQ